MWDFKLLKATQTIEKTMAFMIYRLAMYFVLSLVLVFGILAGTGSGLILDSLFSSPGFFVRIGGFAGFAVFGLVLYWFRSSWFFSMKAPHLVLLNDSIENAFVQQGWAQVRHARSRVSERFTSATELSALDKRIRAVLACLHKQSTGVGQWLSGLKNTNYSRVLARIAEIPATRMDEMIIADCLRNLKHSHSAAAIAALALFAPHFGRLFKNAWILLMLKYTVAFGIFLLMLSPVGWIDEIIPVEFGNWTYVFALLLTWPIKSALLDPIAFAAILGVFLELTQGQTPDPDLESQLARDCPDFASIRNMAEFLDKTASRTTADDQAEN